MFDPKSKKPFKLSRSKIEDSIRCKRCLYLDRRLGIGKPSMPGFSLNIAVDALLKKEFNFHRANASTHPLMEKYGIDAVPFQHEKMDEWRNNFKGITHHHEPTNFIITGAVDDVWINKQGELLIVDYKATSTQEKVTLEGEYKEGYKRQIEIYQWLFRKEGFKVSNKGYFVYANGKKDREAFDGRLDFDVDIIEYEGDDSWVEGAIIEIHECLMSDELPDSGSKCEFCVYRKAAQKIEK